jgi:hypothetical protein
VDDVADREMRLVLLALLDGAARAIEVFESREALHRLLREIAVRHRMTHDGDAQAARPEEPREGAADLRFPDARAHRADRDHGDLRPQHRRLGPEEREVRARGEGDRGRVHDVDVGDVGVGEDDLVDALRGDECCELALVADGQPVRIEWTGELGRIAAARDAGDLGGCEGDDLRGGIVAVDRVEDVEVAASGAEDQDAASGLVRCRRVGIEALVRSSRHAPFASSRAMRSM